MNSLIIESANLKLETKQTGKIIFPSNIYDEKYIGPLYGYYVPDTNVFNVIPIDSPNRIKEDKRISLLGYVLPINPLKFILNENQISDSEDTNENRLMRLTELLRNGEVLNNDEHICIKNGEHSDSIKNVLIPELIKILEFNPLSDSIIEWVECVFGSDKNIYSNLLLGYWDGGNLLFNHISVQGYITNVTKTTLTQETYTLKLDVFSRNTGILESDIMLTKGAVFIGCGSVGSLFALELARAGVGRFMLVDSDILGYHNICRHQCGIFDVGRYKTDAMRDRILQINPYAEVITYNMRIQEVPLNDLMNFCDSNTIVIGGADNREGDLYANGIAQQVGMPFMSIGCWERAFAGEIFYCLPTGMPSYKDFMEVAGHMSARVNQNRRFYTTEAELEKVSFEPGISVDINFVTTIAVKLAIDLLNRDNEGYTQRLLPHLTQYTLVCNTNSTKVGGEMAEIFSYPLQVTTSIVVPYSKKG